jgi:hypothetical protein
MANMLIGSSNVARFYNPDAFPDFRKYNLSRCTTMASFKATMTEMEKGVAIISVFENIIVDAAKGLSKGKDSTKDKDGMEKAIYKSIDAVLELVRLTADRLPETKLAVVTPLQRPSVLWFQEKGDKIYDYIRNSTNTIRTSRNNVFLLDCVCTSLQQFEEDGVHLTMDSGLCFLEDILKKGEAAFKAVNIDLTSDPLPGGSGSGETATLDSTNRRIDDVVGRLTMRFDADNLMFARIREELDSAANLKREDRVVVNGITCKTPLPTDNRQRLEKLKELAMEIFIAIKPDFKGKILFASQGRNAEHDLPSVEVKIDKVEHAIAIRKAFASQRKNGLLQGNLEKVFIANSVNPPTRVRIEILKAIAKKISNSTDLAYVVGFIPRPVMHIKKRGGGDQIPFKTYSFVDAVKYHGASLVAADLGGAYARAGRAFEGQLQQNFVVLRDSDSGLAQSNFHAARQAKGGGAGRGRGAGSGPGSGPWRGRGGHGSGSGTSASSTSTSTSTSTTRGEKRKGDSTIESESKK